MNKPEETMLPINWVLPIFCFSVGIIMHLIFGVKLNGSYSRAEFEIAVTPVFCFMAGCMTLKAYSVSTVGITSKWAAVPRRTVPWESIREAKITPSGSSFHLLFILEGCPIPDFAKGQDYDSRYFFKKNAHYVIILENARKVLPIIEQYYPGEITGKELLSKTHGPI